VGNEGFIIVYVVFTLINYYMSLLKKSNKLWNFKQDCHVLPSTRWDYQ